MPLTEGSRLVGSSLPFSGSYHKGPWQVESSQLTSLAVTVCSVRLCPCSLNPSSSQTVIDAAGAASCTYQARTVTGQARLPPVPRMQTPQSANYPPSNIHESARPPFNRTVALPKRVCVPSCLALVGDIPQLDETSQTPGQAIKWCLGFGPSWHTSGQSHPPSRHCVLRLGFLLWRLLGLRHVEELKKAHLPSSAGPWLFSIQAKRTPALGPLEAS